MSVREIYMFLFFISIFSSCGGIQKMAVGTTASIISDSAYEIESEGNFSIFKSAVPANLKFVEGLLFLSPENKNLLVTLTKGYVGQAFAINETAALYDVLKDNEKTFNSDQAAINYSKAIRYGLRFLEENDIKYDDLTKATKNNNGIIELLDENMDNNLQNLEGVFYTAQALGSLINLRKGKMLLVAQMPIVKGMVDWVCKKNPKFNFGACDIFYGAYEAARPRTLGGNPAKGKRIFLQSIKKYPDNWMNRVSYLQYYVIPMLDQKEFDKQMIFFKRVKLKFSHNQEWAPGKRRGGENPRLRLYQAIALKRYEIMKSLKRDIF